MRILSLTLLFLLSLTSPVFAAQPAIVAFAQDTLANDFRKNQVMEARKAAAAYPEMRFIYSDAKGRTSLLISQIETYIKQQVDVLIIGTNDAQAVVPVVEKAHHAGIRVIILDRGVNTDQYTTFIHSDNTAIGHMAGHYISDQLQGKGKVLLLEGIQSADVTHQRTRGFMTAISDYPEIQVIKRTGNFLRKDALRVTEQLLNDGVEIDAIFSESDSMLSGVRAVLYKHQISPSSIITVGCDYISEAKVAIMKGEQTASVYFPLGGKAAIDIALRIIREQSVEPEYLIGADLLVTRDNASDIAPIF